ncbi:Fungal Zn(2)-Cys(6) binuclear cluster domain-containing protein 13 [Elsinoe fawcettii]|nr:Fungal Zn(2)-Cys(6) binuclear cluster domain-containing protein 13 [Elsinoe fawcettii]
MAHKHASSTTDTSVPPPTRRNTVDLACVECRKRKKKCDGKKPQCSLCFDTNRQCSYPLDSNSAIRNDNKKLRNDLAALQAIFQRIRDTTAEEAEAVVRDIQSSRNYHELGLPSDFGYHDTSNRNSQTPPAISRQASDDVIKRRKLSHAGPGAQTAVTGATSPSRSMPSNDSVHEKSQGKSAGHKRQAFLRFVADHRHGIANAMVKFNEFNGNIFHIYSQEQVAELCESISILPAEQVDDATLCELCAIAALAGHFSRDLVEANELDMYYSVAKQCLDDCIIARPLRALKVTCLLSLYNVVVKATAALAFIHIGLSISTYQDLDFAARPVWWNETEWVDAKKTARTLIFIKGWMETALGFNFGRQRQLDSVSSDDIFVEAGLHDYSCPDYYQSEIAKIGIIKASVMRAIDQPGVGVQDLYHMKASLSTWYSALPGKFQLSNILSANLPHVPRTTILYIHLFYQGSLMLLQRKVLIEALVNPNSDKAAWKSSEALALLKDGFIAGRQGARILSFIQDEDTALSRQCWIVIFHSFITACSALFCAFQRIAARQSPAAWIEDAHLARRSSRALCICGEIDTVARQMQARLEPYLALLSAIEVTESRTKPRKLSREDLFNAEELLLASPDDFAFTLELPTGVEAADAACRELANLVTQPFTSISTLATSPSNSLCSTGPVTPPENAVPSKPSKDYFPAVQSSAHTETTNAGPHVQWNWFDPSEDGPVHGQGYSLPRSTKEIGTFGAYGSAPCGWAGQVTTEQYLVGASTLEPFANISNSVTLNQQRQ